MTSTDPIVAAIGKRLPDQIAFVVHDLRASIRQWSGALGRDDWRIYTYSPENVADLTFRGTPAEFSMRLALCGRGPQIELIQPLSGESVYSEWLDQHGPGMHHLGWFVDNIGDVIRDLNAVGVQPLQSGRGYGLDGDGGFAYYAPAGLDAVVELIEVPKRRRPSEE